MNKEYTNETLKLLNERASLRAFLEDEVTDEVLDQVLQAGIHSASGGNLQPFSIIKIRDKDMMEKVVDFGNQPFIKTAPVNLLFCIDFYRLKRIAKIEKAPFTATKSFAHFWIALQDTIIAAQSICTACDSFGLGSVYIGTIFTDPVSFNGSKELFELPEAVIPVVLVSLGYPKIKPKIANKYGLETIVHENRYRIPTDEELKSAVQKKYGEKGLTLKEQDARIERIKKVCEIVEGKEFADEVEKEILKNGYISTFQYRFGLHYSADFMPSVNEEIIKRVKECGFDIFENPDFCK